MQLNGKALDRLGIKAGGEFRPKTIFGAGKGFGAWKGGAVVARGAGWSTIGLYGCSALTKRVLELSNKPLQLTRACQLSVEVQRAGAARRRLDFSGRRASPAVVLSTIT